MPRNRLQAGSYLHAVKIVLWVGCLFPFALPAAESVVEVDFAVYGGTSGGVIAAAQAARLHRPHVCARDELPAYDQLDVVRRARDRPRRDLRRRNLVAR